MAVSTTVINTVARRLRDNANLAYPRSVLIRFVDHAQRVINAHTKSVVNTATISPNVLHTFSPLYRLFSIVGIEVSSVEDVRLDGRSLNRFDPWQQIVHQDPRWFSTRGPRYIAFGTLGKDILILYPIVSPVPATQTIALDYVPTQPSVILDNGSNDIALADDLIPLLEDLVEALGCLKGRRYSEASDPIGRFQLQLSVIGRTIVEQDVEGKV